MSELVLPLARLPLPPGEPMASFVQEAEQNTESRKGLPWMVVGGNRKERLAVLRSDLSPAQCAAAERELFALDEVLWVLTAGEAVLTSGAGMLRHVFLRRSFPGGSWELHTRPFITHIAGLDWLGAWCRESGQGPEGGRLAHLFVEPAKQEVRLVSQDVDVPPQAMVKVPEGANAQDVAHRAGHLMESWFVSKGRLPTAVLRYSEGLIEARLMPKHAAQSEASDLALRLAQDPTTLAVGVFTRGRDKDVQPPAEQLLLQLEFRDGPALSWRRRYRIVAQNRARWLDPAGEVSGRPGGRRWLQG